MANEKYATVAEVKAWMPGTIPTGQDTNVGIALDAAEETIEKFCRRRFNLDVSVSARKFTAISGRLFTIPDVGTLTGLIVKIDQGNDGVYESTLTIDTDFLALPANAIVEGEPVTMLETTPTRGSYTWPTHRLGVEVTAKWGWPSVPEAIKQAVLIQAEFNWKRQDAPFGILESPGMPGTRIPAQLDPTAMTIARGFKRYRVGAVV